MRVVAIVIAVSVSACGFFQPPCAQVAKAICSIGDEGEACAALNNVRRNDEPAQRACEGVLPAAQAYAADPSAGKGGWDAVAGQLEIAGYQRRTRTISEKLKQAGGTAGKTVQKLEDANRLAEESRANGAEDALRNAEQ